jgi:carbonic anhydrase
LKEKYNVDYVDTITEDGVDKLFSYKNNIQGIKSNTLLSINSHGSKLIMVSGHHDCTGNPVSKQEHAMQIKKAISIIQTWNKKVKVIGVWINEDWDLKIL